MSDITALLQRISDKIPVTWDRFTEYGDYYNIYGWIDRSDGLKMDFLLLQGGYYTDEHDNRQLEMSYVTSSAKYSRKINEVMFGEDAPHCDCRKIEELYQDLPQSNT